MWTGIIIVNPEQLYSRSMCWRARKCSLETPALTLERGIFLRIIRWMEHTDEGVLRVQHITQSAC